MYAGDFKAVSKMMEAVKEGKDLPPLNDMGKDKLGEKSLFDLKFLKKSGWRKEKPRKPKSLPPT